MKKIMRKITHKFILRGEHDGRGVLRCIADDGQHDYADECDGYGPFLCGSLQKKEPTKLMNSEERSRTLK